MVDPRLPAFTRTTLLPTYAEIAASPRMLRDFAIHIYDDAIDDPLHAALVDELHREVPHPIGPVLLVEDLDAKRRSAPFGGRYLVAPMFRTDGDAIHVSPVVMFQMAFDRKLHVFMHRYALLAEIAVEKVTRAMILNHVLNSFSFFRVNALSPTRPW